MRGREREKEKERASEHTHAWRRERERKPFDSSFNVFFFPLGLPYANWA